MNGHLTPDQYRAVAEWFLGLSALAFMLVLAWLAWETGRDGRE